MPSALMTSAHFWVSSSISFSNSCGEVGLASRPVVCTYFCTALLLSAMRKALFSSSLFSLGLALGENMPYQLLACTFLMPSSSKVGQLGSTAVRLSATMAMGRTWDSYIGVAHE